MIQDFLHHLNTEGYEPVAPIQIGAANWRRLMYNGEKRGNASGGYRLIQNPDGSLFANYGSSKDPAGFRSWSSDRTREKSYEELAAEQAARDLHRKAMEDREARVHARVGRWIARVIAHYPVAESHPYLTDKKIQAHGVKIREKTGELLIPRYADDRKIYGGQKIRQKKTGIKSFKSYVKNARSKGLFYPIGVKDSPCNTVVIVEGFATGASVYEATGLPVFVAFDAGNLALVGKSVKKMYPNARIVIAGDEDHWTFAPNKKPKGIEPKEIAGDDQRWKEWRDAGLLYNTGADKAPKAAVAIGGAHVIFPDFPKDHAAKGTDFNDLVNEKGADYVKMMFDKILEIPRATVEEVGGGSIHESLDLDVQAPAADDRPSKKKKGRGDLEMNFRVLGYNNGNFYYFPFSSKQILCLGASSHSINNLMQLDTLAAWESGWRDESGKVTAQHSKIAMYAADRLMSIARQRGVFQAEDRVRGAGAWIDDGRVVLHCGDVLYVDGVKTQLDEIDSYYMYIASVRLMRPAPEPIANSEAARLRKICESLTWENPMSGSLLAGWLVIAPICSALTWRPHIWLTGEAGSGKSTVLNKIIKPVLGRLGHYVDGKSTEPSIRDQMGYNARPLVFDEAEPSGSIERVLDLARAASSGGRIDVSGKAPFIARFCACFSAINPPVKKTSDESRICFMVIKRNRKATAQEDYNRLLSQIEETITEGFAERLLARTLENMDSLIANIRVFNTAFRTVTKEARSADQIAPMLAGLYMLGRTGRISEEDAVAWVSKWDWEDHSMIHQLSDPLKLVQYIAESLVRPSTGTSEISIGDLIEKAHLEKDSQADRVLGYYGIKVKDARVYIASSSHNLAKVLRDTEWNVKWSRTLSDVQGARKEKSEYFSRGVRTSAISLPVEMFLTREEEHETLGF